MRKNPLLFLYVTVSENQKQKMKRRFKSIIFLLILIIAAACSTTKFSTTKLDDAKPLKLDPRNYHNVRFNPEWIAENNIESIIKREYLDGKNGKVHLVSILEYDKNGYLKTKYGGLSYPKSESPTKEDIFSRSEYKIISLDSFIVHSSNIIRYHNENGKMDQPDTLKMGTHIYNLKSAKVYLNENGEVYRKYFYDESDRLIKELDKNGEESFSIKYLENGKIEIVEFSRWKGEKFSSIITKDKFGRIVKNFDESNNLTNEFYYDKKGNMVEDKHWFEGKEPNYHTYEYISNDSR
ncbi:hypothetical protein [Bizionia sp.]|uniref:hypothetical protein n=1 Tax=Bizionia sp. TaxID=1954480 RepID=UPI003A91A5F1